MDPLQEKILQTVDANNGSVRWEDLVESLDYRERQQAFSAVRALKQAGMVSRNVSFDQTTGQSQLTIARVAQG